MRELKNLKKLADEFFEEAEKFISKQKEPLVQEVNKTIKWGPESEKEMNWYEAKEWCEEQGGRLPTRFELQCAYEDEEVRKTFQPDCSWSSTDFSGTNAWYVNFNNGNTSGSNKSTSFYVRCILN